jgi:hypothetical protein
MANDIQAQVPATAPANVQVAPATTQMAPATANGMTPPVKKSKKWLWWTIGAVALIVVGIIIYAAVTA